MKKQARFLVQILFGIVFGYFLGKTIQKEEAGTYCRIKKYAKEIQQLHSQLEILQKSVVSSKSAAQYRDILKTFNGQIFFTVANANTKWEKKLNWNGNYLVLKTDSLTHSLVENFSSTPYVNLLYGLNYLIAKPENQPFFVKV